MNSLVGILLSLSACVCLLIGSFIVFKTKNNEKVVTFSVSIGMMVLILLVVFHLVPECIEVLGHEFNSIQSYAYLFLMVLIGMSLLKGFDYFVPHHHGHEEGDHLNHVAMITCLALFLHNVIEGMALYTTTMSSIKSGVLLAIGVGLHNIPLGLTISSGFYKDKGSVKKTILYIVLLGLSTFLGAVLISLFNGLDGNALVNGTIFGITVGMIIYIVCFELWHSFRRSNDSYVKAIGLVVGAVIMVLTTIL